ncbi:MAG TPA: alpha/beta fold hydrolase [Candidatus Stackebrandtia faecavium]|nr:alpha/beta fold hydrolase [Candidatus Stackebrandtia faecavium]
MPTQPDGYARNGTTQLAYDDLGGAGGQPLLLVMGAAVTRFWWPAGFVSQLIDRGFHVARFDNRDSGQSTRFPMRNRGPITSVLRPNSPAYRFEDMTDDVVSVLDALGWDSAHLFGHSLGGLIVQRTAIRHPDRVRSIVSSAAVPSDGKARHMLRYIRPGLIAKLTRLRFPDTPDGDVAFAMEISRLLSSPGYPFDEAEARARVSQDAYCPVRDQAIMGRQLGASWGGGRLKQIQTPATILHGEADQLLRTCAARDLAAAIDGAELHTYPGVGHDLPKEMWPVYAERVRKNADRATSRST